MAREKQQKAERKIFLQACIARGVQLQKEKEKEIATLRGLSRSSAQGDLSLEHPEETGQLPRQSDSDAPQEAGEIASRLQETEAELNRLKKITREVDPESDLTTLPKPVLCTLTQICIEIDISYDPALKPHEFFKLWMHTFADSTKPDEGSPLEQRSRKELLQLLADHQKRLQDGELTKVPPVCWVRCSSVLRI